MSTCQSAKYPGCDTAWTLTAPPRPHPPPWKILPTPPNILIFQVDLVAGLDWNRERNSVKRVYMPLAPNCQIVSWQKTQFASQLAVQKRMDKICEVEGRPMQSNRTERHFSWSDRSEFWLNGSRPRIQDCLTFPYTGRRNAFSIRQFKWVASFQLTR